MRKTSNLRARARRKERLRTLPPSSLFSRVMSRPAGSVVTLLTGGDRRSIGRVAEVVAIVRSSPRRLPSLVKALAASNPVVVLRAADAIEKLSRLVPGRMAQHRATFLRVAARTTDPAVRWNLIQALTRVPSSRRAALGFARRLEVWYFVDRSAIVRTCALDALVTMAEGDARVRPAARAVFQDASRSGSAALRARARRLAAEWLRGDDQPIRSVRR